MSPRSTTLEAYVSAEISEAVCVRAHMCVCVCVCVSAADISQAMCVCVRARACVHHFQQPGAQPTNVTGERGHARSA